MNKINAIIATCLVALTVSSCKDDNVEPIIVVPPSSGSTLTLQGLIGEEAGSSAGNAVYVDLSTDTQTPVARESWDLGFTTDSEFRVILNNTLKAGAKVLTKSSLSEVGEADTIGLTLAYSQSNPLVSDFDYYDALDGDLTKTVIPTISATAADNKIIILNREGTKRPWVKLKITRNGNGYKIEYGGIKQTSDFKSVTIAKNTEYTFNYLSLTTGSEVQVAPKKGDWDIVWGYSIYETNFGSMVPYAFSDLVFSNIYDKVEVSEVVVTDENPTTYAQFDASHLATLDFSKNRDAIGSKWRATTGAAIGVKTDRFYVIKDPKGNVYKLKFNSFISNDGGTRGKPEIQYELIKEGNQSCVMVTEKAGNFPAFSVMAITKMYRNACE